jgi:hypothetical protein
MTDDSSAPGAGLDDDEISLIDLRLPITLTAGPYYSEYGSLMIACDTHGPDYTDEFWNLADPGVHYSEDWARVGGDIANVGLALELRIRRATATEQRPGVGESFTVREGVPLHVQDPDGAWVMAWTVPAGQYEVHAEFTEPVRVTASN